MDKSNLNKNKSFLIKKASGETELFLPEKLERSLQNAGARQDTITEIISHVEEWIHPGVTTKEIYSRAFSILKREKSTSGLRYKLKRAIYELGPTGYPFENLVGQIFKKQGFEIEVGVIVDGNCVSHEMDVIATRNSEQHLVECKYHKDQGRHVSIQVPLYVRSRVNDIINKRKDLNEFSGFSFTGWVVTNTRFSDDSIQYAKCSGLKLMAWDYPSGKGLKDMVEKLKIYPITILNNLSLKEKRSLLEQGIVTCSQLSGNIQVLDTFNLIPRKYKSVIRELKEISF